MALTSPAAPHGAPSLGAGGRSPRGLHIHLCAQDGHSSAAAPASRTPAVGGTQVARPCRPSREERHSPHAGQAWALPPLQTPGLAQHPRLPCSRPWGPSRERTLGASTMSLVFNEKGDSCQESCPPQRASTAALPLHRDRGPQGGPGSTTGGQGPQGGPGVHKEGQGPQGGTGVHKWGRGSTGGQGVHKRGQGVHRGPGSPQEGRGSTRGIRGPHAYAQHAHTG